MTFPLFSDNNTGESQGAREVRSTPVQIPFGGGASRDEMNLAEFPLAVLSTRVNPHVKTLVFRDSQRSKDGDLIEREWIITGADKFGLPTSTDDDVVLGLMRLTMDHGFRERKIYFTRYELLKALRWSTEGRSYGRLTKSLDRLSGVRIRAANAFFDNSSKAYQTRNFGIIDAYELNDERGGKSGKKRLGVGSEAGKEGRGETKSFFIWSEVLFDSFKAGFIKKLDLDFYFSLRSAVSRRLYRYLDKHFYFKPIVERQLTVLAFEKLGLSRSYQYISSIKQQLEPALEELTKLGFLSGHEYVGHGDGTFIRFFAERSEVQAAHRITKNAGDTAPTGVRNKVKDGLVESLLSRGLTLGQANRLLAEKSSKDFERIEVIIRYYDQLVESGDQKVSRNRVGFLYRAVESPFKFTLPPALQPGGASVPEQLSFRETAPRKRADLKVFRAAPEDRAAMSRYDAYRRRQK